MCSRPRLRSSPVVLAVGRTGRVRCRQRDRVAAEVVVLWLVTGGRVSSGHAERRAQPTDRRLVRPARRLRRRRVGSRSGGRTSPRQPAGSGSASRRSRWSRCRRSLRRNVRVATAMGSSAAASESCQSKLCAHLSLPRCWSVCLRTPLPTGGGRSDRRATDRGGRGTAKPATHGTGTDALAANPRARPGRHSHPQPHRAPAFAAARASQPAPRLPGPARRNRASGWRLLLAFGAANRHPLLWRRWSAPAVQTPDEWLAMTAPAATRHAGRSNSHGSRSGEHARVPSQAGRMPRDEPAGPVPTLLQRGPVGGGLGGLPSPAAVSR